MIFPWQRTAWNQLTGRLDRLPHAMLLAGPEGLGKREFAHSLAARLLCASPTTDELACGVCEGCRWFASGNHPDYRLLTPDAELGDDGTEGDLDTNRAGGKEKKSLQIRIEQIRALADFVSLTHHRPTARVVVIQPAEAMNLATANALLKLLEEPPAGTVFLLVSHQPRHLLPTIRSRCQMLGMPRPQLNEVQAWLAGQGIQAGAEVIAFCSGQPLMAAELLSGPGWTARQRFVKDMESLPVQEPVLLAGQWEAWLKSKDAGALDLSQLITWVQKWLIDLNLVATGNPARFFPDRQDTSARISRSTSAASITRCYREISKLKEFSQHPINLRLFLDDLLLRVAQLWTSER